MWGQLIKMVCVSVHLCTGVCDVYVFVVCESMWDVRDVPCVMCAVYVSACCW